MRKSEHAARDCGRELPLPLMQMMPRKAGIGALAAAAGMSERKTRHLWDGEIAIRGAAERARIMRAQAWVMRDRAARMLALADKADADARDIEMRGAE